MKIKSQAKVFDAVKMMREIRDRLCRKYADDPQLQERELARIRKKYGIRSKVKV